MIEKTLVHELGCRYLLHKYWIFDKHSGVPVNECLQDAVILVWCQENCSFDILVSFCSVKNTVHAQVVVECFYLLSYTCCTKVRIFYISKSCHCEKRFSIIWMDILVAEMALLEFFFHSLSHCFYVLVLSFMVLRVFSLLSIFFMKQVYQLMVFGRIRRFVVVIPWSIKGLGVREILAFCWKFLFWRGALLPLLLVFKVMHRWFISVLRLVPILFIGLHLVSQRRQLCGLQSDGFEVEPAIGWYWLVLVSCSIKLIEGVADVFLRHHCW